MKLLGEQTSLVIAGAWNPAILNPNWIGRQILGYPPGKQFQVGMQLPVMGVSAPARLSFEGMSITAAKDALTFHLDSTKPEQIQKSISVAAKILETLPHTPIAAMGFNFGYSVDGVPGLLSGTFDWSEDLVDLLPEPDSKLAQRSWQVSLAVKDHLINVSCERTVDGAVFAINHHYEVEGSATRAAEILHREDIYGSIFALSETFVKRLTSTGDEK